MFHSWTPIFHISYNFIILQCTPNATCHHYNNVHFWPFLLEMTSSIIVKGCFWTSSTNKSWNHKNLSWNFNCIPTKPLNCNFDYVTCNFDYITTRLGLDLRLKLVQLIICWHMAQTCNNNLLACCLCRATYHLG